MNWKSRRKEDSRRKQVKSKRQFNRNTPRWQRGQERKRQERLDTLSLREENNTAKQNKDRDNDTE